MIVTSFYQIMIILYVFLFSILDHTLIFLCYLKAWILDATPGKVRAGGDGEDHPAELISLLSTLPKEVDI